MLMRGHPPAVGWLGIEGWEGQKEERTDTYIIHANTPFNDKTMHGCKPTGLARCKTVHCSSNDIAIYTELSAAQWKALQ